MGMIQEFKDFAVKGNVVDMGVGIVIGAAFTSIVTSFVTDIINPIISLFTGGVEHAFDHDLFQGPQGVGRIVAHEHALAAGQAGGLDDVSELAGFEVGLGALGVGERAGLGSGDGGAMHEFFRPGLVGLEQRALGTWPEDRASRPWATRSGAHRHR